MISNERRRRVRARTRLVVSGALLAFSLSAACVKTGTSTERVPVTQNLGSFRTASIAVDVAPDIENPSVWKSQLGTFLENDLKDRKLFVDVPATGGELTLKITIRTLDKPVSVAGLPFGKVDMTGAVELVDAKTTTTVGAFDITANSKQQVKSSFNGVDTSTGEDPRKRAMMAAADQIATYIEEHRTGAAKARATPVIATASASASAAAPPAALPPSTPPPSPPASPATGTPTQPPPSMPPPPPAGPPGSIAIRSAPFPANLSIADRSLCSLVCVSVSGAPLKDDDTKAINKQLSRHLGAMRSCVEGGRKTDTAVVLRFGPQGSGEVEYDFGARSNARQECRAALPAVSVSGAANTVWRCTDYCG